MLRTLTWYAEEEEILKKAETRVIALGHMSRPLVFSGCVMQRRGETAGRIIACVFDRALQKAGPTAQLDYVLDCHGYQPLLNMNIMPYVEVARHLDCQISCAGHSLKGLVYSNLNQFYVILIDFD